MRLLAFQCVYTTSIAAARDPGLSKNEFVNCSVFYLVVRIKEQARETILYPPQFHLAKGKKTLTSFKKIQQ